MFRFDLDIREMSDKSRVSREKGLTKVAHSAVRSPRDRRKTGQDPINRQKEGGKKRNEPQKRTYRVGDPNQP